MTHLDEAIDLLSRTYRVMRNNTDKKGTPLWDSFMELLMYVENDVISMGGDCPP